MAKICIMDETNDNIEIIKNRMLLDIKFNSNDSFKLLVKSFTIVLLLHGQGLKAKRDWLLYVMMIIGS
jgi:hypothetical protein